MTTPSVVARVTATSPLRVQLDGDTSPLPITPRSLVGAAALAVDDMVLCQWHGGRLFVIGMFGGPPAPAAASTSAAGLVELATLAEVRAGTDQTRAVTPDSLYAVNGMTRLIPASVTDGSVDAEGNITPVGNEYTLHINDVFEQRFASYMIVWNFYLSGNYGLQMRLSSGGSSNSAGYDSSYVGHPGNGSASGSTATSQGHWLVDSGASAERHWGHMILQEPMKADYAKANGVYGGRRSGGSFMTAGQRSHFHVSTSQFDGFLFFLNSSAGDILSGSVRVYGMS